MSQIKKTFVLDTNVILHWPIYPTGFKLEATTNQITPFNWSVMSATPTVTNSTNYVTLGTTNTTQLFRLRRP